MSYFRTAHGRLSAASVILAAAMTFMMLDNGTVYVWLALPFWALAAFFIVNLRNAPQTQAPADHPE
ncbi:MAG: hypothetical protein AAF586_11735 [Planctomycetota bacterium]